MDENAYPIKNSEQELVRLQIQADLFNDAIRTIPLCFDPAHYPHARILDLGSGPGSYALQVALLYPDYDVVGVDINPAMIAYAQAQAEVQHLDVDFRTMDIVQPWPFADCSFDFVNMRFGAGFVSAAKAPQVFAEAYRVLAPGGVLRDTESVWTSTPSEATQHMISLVAQGLHKAGLTYSSRDMSISAAIASLFTRIGFEQIEIYPYVLDVSANAPLHDPTRDDMHLTTMLLKPFLVQQLHVCTSDKFDEIWAAEQRDWDDPSFSGHWYVSSVCGTKPE